MRRIAEILLWLVKGLLLATAFAALFVWTLTYARGYSITLVRIASHPDHEDSIGLVLASRGGRVGIADGHRKFIGQQLKGGHDLVTTYGAGWHWISERGAEWFVTDQSGHSFASVRWDDVKDAGISSRAWFVSLPCWMLALLSGAWPAISLARLGRRQSRKRRLARVGSCLNCGYDLRATPTACGELLSRCPECGTATTDSQSAPQARSCPEGGTIVG